jgi:hypothetical protein
VIYPEDEGVFEKQIAALPGKLRRDHLQTPADCTPRPQLPSAWKERAITKILAAVRGQAKWMPWHGQPAELQVFISDFDWYSVYIDVYLPDLNKTINIATRSILPPQKDITAWDELSAAFQARKATPSWIRIMRKYGIARTIRWKE